MVGQTRVDQQLTDDDLSVLINALGNTLSIQKIDLSYNNAWV